MANRIVSSTLRRVVKGTDSPLRRSLCLLLFNQDDRLKHTEMRKCLHVILACTLTMHLMSACFEKEDFHARGYE